MLNKSFLLHLEFNFFIKHHGVYGKDYSAKKKRFSILIYLRSAFFVSSFCEIFRRRHQNQLLSHQLSRLRQQIHLRSKIKCQLKNYLDSRSGIDMLQALLFCGFYKSKRFTMLEKIYNTMTIIDIKHLHYKGTLLTYIYIHYTIYR